MTILCCHARKAQNESLMQSLQQKNKLLELAQGIQDEKISKEMKDIAYRGEPQALALPETRRKQLRRAY